MDAATLAAYLGRIGVAATDGPTLATLRALHLAHPQAIPFENLSPLGGEDVDLADEGIAAKLVASRRGGYCYEHNLLLQGVLSALGFATRGLAARVRWNVPAGMELPRTHMLLQVDLPEGPYIADVGFGGWTLTAPLALVADVAQPTPHGTFRLRRDDDGWTLDARIGTGWRALYTFDTSPQRRVDYELTSWYLCRHPRSRFVSELIVARIGPDRRLALRGRRFTIHRTDGGDETREFGTLAELEAVLDAEFGIRVPAADRLRARLREVCGLAA